MAMGPTSGIENGRGKTADVKTHELKQTTPRQYRSISQSVCAILFVDKAQRVPMTVNNNLQEQEM
jgi:hypothetical protein